MIAAFSRFGVLSWMFLALFMGTVSSAYAGEFCSTFPDPSSPGDGLIDGNDAATLNFFVTNNVTQITIDTNCTFRNWPASNPLDVTINFQTNDPSVYLIVFDNVEYTGNMACANIDHKLWFVNGSSYNFSSKCQDLFIPVEAISKKVPAGKTTVGIGEPFTYTLTIPVLYDPVTGTVISDTGTNVDVHSINISDDLDQTGADLTFVSTDVTYNGNPLPHSFNAASGLLTYDLAPFVVPASDQVQIDITVVPDATNAVGTQFFNTARWSFGRVISLDPDGDGIYEDVFFDPLPGENGVSEILTIGAPDLTMTKSSLDTTLSPGGVGSFTLDVQNNGTSAAWETTLVDRLPESATASMCGTDPTTISPVTAAIYQADGSTLVNALTAGTDFTVSFTGSPACELTLVMTGANSVIDVGQRLIVNYQAQLEPGATVNGEVLTNVAGATQWFSGDGSYPRTTFSEILSNGTPGDAADHEDSFDVTVGLAGYYFQKTVANLNTGANPATTAQAGDTLRYRLRVFNVNQNVNAVTITDQLDLTRLNAGSFSLVSAPAAASVNFNAVTGLLTINGGAGSLDVAQGAELVVEFDVDTLTTLVNNDLVSNQALLTSTSGANVESDDPFVNGVDDPQDAIDQADPTDVVIQQPGTLTKTNGPVSAAIGETFTYTITVPEVPTATPLYDVRISDALGMDSSGTTSIADVSFVSAVDAGNTWTLTNSGTASSPVIEDLNSGIDIPANGQAVITMTVRLDNTLTNQTGLQFYNAASYTYNRTNGVPATQAAGGSVVTTSPTTVYEPGIATFSKVADNTTPTAGDVVRYTITMTAQSGVNVSDVFDVTLIDSLDLGLAYVANSATVSTGAGVGSDNTVLSTDVTGDGITAAQTLIWGVADVDIDIQAGDTVTLEYEVQVLNNVLGNTVLNNAVVAQWTSTDGANGFERDGSDGLGGLNDYITLGTEILTTPGIASSIIKERFTDTFDASDDDVRIGDIVYYTLTIPIPEGTLGNLELVDTLPQGLDFEGIVSISGDTATPYAATAPFAYTDIPDSDIVEAGNPVTGPTTVTWALGNVTNQPNDGVSDDFIIVYSARVLDNVLAQVDNTPLNNTVVMTYDTATATVTASDTDTIIDVLQPNLSVSKSAAPAGGDNLINAAEVVTYTVDIINDGTAPAYDTVLQDVLPVGLRQGGVTTTSITRVNTATNTVTATLANFAPAYDVATGTTTWDFDTGVADAYSIPVGETLRIVYEVQADAGIAEGLTLTNAATGTRYYSFDDDAVPTLGTVSGTREIYGPTNTASTTLYTGAPPPTKALITPVPGNPVATIGEIVEYQLTIPGALSTSTLFDVQITDTLDVNLEIVNVNIVGGIGVTNNTVTANDLDVSVDEIAAGTQVVINLQARVRNIASAQQGTAIDNAITYTYAFVDNGPQLPALTSIDVVTVTLIEPDLTVTKTATPITPAPITGGDIIEYQVSIQNNGQGTSFDTNIVDTIPAGMALDGSFMPTASINAAPVAGFITTPSGAPAGPLVWGRDNGDGSLDIPVAGTLVLTYRVLIDASAEANVTLTNSVLADYTSLDGVDANERDGAGCPAIVAPDDYCSAPATSDITTVDSNSFSKSIIDDSFAPNNDSTVRIGDTVTYQLSLNLQEGTTENVAVNDVLDAGLEFVGIVSINGDTTADYIPPAAGAGSNFSYAAVTAGALPAAGQTGTLTFTLGDVTNDPVGDPTTDTLTIVYQARVTENTIAQTPSTTLDNTATLAYMDGNGNPIVDPSRLVDTASLTVLQPVMTVPTKVDAVFSSGAIVNVATDTMQFTIESCNTTGMAPAYDLRLTDDLPTHLNETTLTTPVVQLYDAPSGSGGNLLATLVDGVGYSYTAPAGRGGSIVIDMIDPIDPGNCITASYDIGFYTDFGPNQVWNNSITVDEYWSLPSASGQMYTPLGPAIFVMTNGPSSIDPPVKVMTVPASGEATIGEQVVYQITVPGTFPNSALYDVVITDALHASLEYISAVDISGNGFTLTDNTSGNNVSLAIAQIPAGQQAVIELTARVANNANANAGTSFTNTASYSFANSPGGTTILGGNGTTATSLLIVEPTIGINKAVANISTPNPTDSPTAGNILRYTVTLTASGGAAGDNFSGAFDATIIDNLSLGLAYVPGSATVGGGNIINDPTIVGDGVTTPQTMTWQLSDGTADIDIAEGVTVIVSYDVAVLNGVLANQALSNSAVTQWTGLDGIDANERTGVGTPTVNDYFTGPITTTVTTPDTTALTKSRLTDTFGAGDADVRIGDIVEYQVTVVLPEGQSNNVVITDTLPQGMAFEEVAQINGDTSAPFSSVAPFTYNDITPVVSGNPATGPSTVTFTLGDVVNAGDNNPANDTFVIVYRVRLLDNVFSQVNSTPLANAVQLVYTSAAGQQTQNDSVGVTLLQPQLTVAKTASAAGGDTVIESGEIITYTVTVTNNGAAPAYDVVVEDIIPAGLRLAGVTTNSITLSAPAEDPADFNPAYVAATGTATWNFDAGATADTYTIDPGQTLVIVYEVQADAGLGAGLTLTNLAVASVYYSLDDDAIPSLGGVSGIPEVYGPSNTDSTTLTTASAGALLKQTPFELTAIPDDQTVTIGETFSYRITVPETPLPLALHDVRILDNLNASAAELSFVSVSKLSPSPGINSQPWTPVNTGSLTNLVIEDTTTGIDIPAGEQVIIDVTVQVDNAVANTAGLIFTNDATYTYNQLPNNPGTQQPGLPDTSGDMIIIAPDNLTMVKTGAVTMRVGVPQTFTLTVHNDNTGGNAAPAWDVTVTDVLPDIGTGGMCDTAPVNITAGIYQDSAGTLLVSALTDGLDYSTSYSGCTLSITMQSANAALPVNNYLIITYDAALDADTPPNSTLTNIAGATEWFSNDTAGSGATGATRTFTEALSDGTVSTLDHEDAHTLTTEAPVISFEKTVFNLTTGQPGTDASPGDTLRYTIQIENISDVDLPDFTFIDELDALNTTPAFAAGTLVVTNAGGGDASATNANGGANGTGLVSISNLSLAPQTSPPNNVVTIVFEVTLAPVITSGTVVLNQGQILAPGVNQLSDDPSGAGATDPTGTLITSAPLFDVFKTSQDITGDPNILLSGDTLRYTITVKNIGSENAINTLLRDQPPANTTYVAGSTRLNGVVAADLAGGVSPLQNGILINAPEDTTPGFMRADTSATAGNTATITFDVVIDGNVVNGTVISNQAFLAADGAGSGPMPEEPSDDPVTAVLDDPTLDVVGNQPLVDAHKTVSIAVDNGSPGTVDPGDVLRYTITVINIGASPATGVSLIDAVPFNTTYVANSVTLNGIAVGQPDGGLSPLASGIAISSSDQTPPLPVGNGNLSVDDVATVTFDVQVNAGVAAGTIISNQGSIDSNELPAELTDADGIESNGDQPTVIAVGNPQLLSITKQVAVIGGGPALAGGQLEYRVRVSNIGSAAATNVVVTDNLDLPVAGQLSYVAGSGTLNGRPVGISVTGPVVTADFASVYGDLQPGLVAELRFIAQINSSLPIGTSITNTAEVSWNSPAQTESASVSIDVGGTPGAANLNGMLWHDPNHNNVYDSGEVILEGWSIDLYLSGQLLGTFTTDTTGVYLFNGLLPNDFGTDRYELRYRAPGAGANTALLGMAESPYTDDLQRIYDIVVSSGGNVQNLNLPIDPNGVVYNSIVRTPVAGATLTLLNVSNGNMPVPTDCLDDPAHQNQVTLTEGYYKFDINFSSPACNVGDTYVIEVTPPANGYIGTTSRNIPPTLSLTDLPFSVEACPGSTDDRLPTSPEYCEIQASAFVPPTSVAPRTSGTSYYMQFTLGNSTDPYTSQIFNNHIPVDPELGAVVAITKTSSLLNVTRSQLVPYTITVSNSLGVPLPDMDIVDSFPAGFKYVAGSARIDGAPSEPVVDGLQMTWPGLTLNPAETRTIKMLLIVGSGVSEGDYINRVQVINNRTGEAVSEQATATVRVIPDPTFDCSDVIGKVFNDANLNGYQDEGEGGIPSARVVSARGLEAKTDQHGRFHITCAVVPNENRGSNFVLKLDERSLPTGYRVITENPRVERATRGKMLKFNFATAVHRVVRLDMADAVFEPNSTEIRPQWVSRISLLIEKLVEAPSILRLVYIADVDDASLVEDRVDATRKEIERRWEDLNCCYTLEIETEIFWRRGKPPDRDAFE